MRFAWLLLLFAAPALAAPIPGLFDTGVDANRVALTDGAIDPHYKLVASADPAYPGPNVYACWPIASGYWLANTASSRWIGPAANEGYPTGAPTHPEGLYTYRLSFDLSGFDTTSVQVTGFWGADNNGSMQLNGQPAGSGTGGYNPLASFTISNGFKSGINTLDFIVYNLPAGGANPTALRVQGLAGTGTPLLLGADEPALSFTLAAPVPNPSTSSTRLDYALARAGQVRLTIRNVAGRTVRNLVDRFMPAGSANAVWEGTNDAGALVPAGIYFVVLEHEGGTSSRRLVRFR